MKWTQERMELLRSMWLAGQTAGTIAKTLGETTRHAVMGKIDRMGLMRNAEHNSKMTWTPVGCCRPAMVDPDVIMVSCGTIARACKAQRDQTTIDWRMAHALLEDLTGQAYDPSTQGHRASLIGISTILARGDARKILVPRMSEPSVLQMMRRLAEKGFVIGGKTPERWRDEESGDVAFFDDMLIAEDVTEHRKVVARVSA